MRYNLKNHPKRMKWTRYVRKRPQFYDEQIYDTGEIYEWLVGFEAELRELQKESDVYGGKFHKLIREILGE